MRSTDSTKLALAEDFKWKSSEGFIVVWTILDDTPVNILQELAEL